MLHRLRRFGRADKRSTDKEEQTARWPAARQHTRMALRLPDRLAQEKSPEHIKVVHSQDTPIGHLHGFGISDVHIKEIPANLHLFVDLPSLTVVIAEGRADAAVIGVPSGARTIGAK